MMKNVFINLALGAWFPVPFFYLAGITPGFWTWAWLTFTTTAGIIAWFFGD